MFKIMSAGDAIEHINDGDCIGINSFIGLGNPEALHQAVYNRFIAEGHPKNLSIFCSAGFGIWDKNRFAEPYIAAGAVKEVVAGHYAGMLETVRLAAENKIEAYNLPLGVLSHTVRAAASGKDGYISKVGLNTFVDPRVGTPSLNRISNRKLVELITIDTEYLYYKTPKLNVAFIRGTTVDPVGNISFEREYVTVDALSVAQATKNNGGYVIVEVENVSHVFARPGSVVIPGILVDAVVVNNDRNKNENYNPALSGDIHVPPTHMDYYMSMLTTSRSKRERGGDISTEIIGKRAAMELRSGYVVNIGIGIPEKVGKYASELGVLRDITTTVESGGIGGVPAPGVAFGATIGADMICSMATQFDFYDGGGLDACFMGGLEVDKDGNVNAHQLPHSFVGIGGFANITSATKRIIFCMNFTTKGLIVSEHNDKVVIEQEGSINKFKNKISAISFSAKSALQKGQRVLYVTERCVFELAKDGLRLVEVFNGVDVNKDIIDKLDFKLAN
ncbi:MAG: CoA-transferase [Clostridia bacterium]